MPEPKRRKSTLEATSHDTKPPPARGRWTAVLAFLAVAVVVGAGFALGSRFFETAATPEPSARSDAPAASAPQPAASPRAPEPQASAEPPVEASAAPAVSASAEAVVDLAKLPPNKAQIMVEPPLPGIDLWVNGVRAGPADQKVVARCGTVPVVFMTPDMSWKSKPRAIAIVCRKLNRVSIEPATTPLPAQPTKAAPKPRPAPKTAPKTAPKSAPKGSQWLRR